MMQSLMPLLPEIDRTEHGLKSFLSSPQFQQAVAAFQAAIHGGHKDEILRQLGCNPADTVQDASVMGSFIKSIEKAASRK